MSARALLSLAETAFASRAHTASFDRAAAVVAKLARRELPQPTTAGCLRRHRYRSISGNPNKSGTQERATILYLSRLECGYRPVV